MNTEKSEWIKFGSVASRLGTQSQYAARYTGIDDSGNYNPLFWSEHGYESLGEGLRFKGNSDDYHFMEIHADDVEEFVKRYKEEKA